jgi:hypothetical protein
MNADDLEKKLEHLSTPQVPPMQHQWQLKFAILSAKKSAKAALWLMLIPVLMLGTGLLQSQYDILIPPWSWLVEYSPGWPVWIRFGVFAIVVIIIPLIAVLLNLLSIIWLEYDRPQKVLHISIRMRPLNLLIIAIAGLLALLFIGHTIADSVAGKG